MRRKRSTTPSAGARGKSWTVAVFMVGDPELRSAMKRDLLELESVGSSDDVNVVVAQQETARSGTNWFEIPPGTDNNPSRRQKIGQSDGPLEKRLDKFLRFLLRAHEAEHYLLILWGHASGFGFGQLEPRSEDDRLQLNQVGKVLAAFRANRGGRKLEILGCCACALSKAEFALELRDEVDFLVSSQIGISTLMTWPFDTILERVVTSPHVEPQSLAGQIVQCFEDSYEPPPIALTALDLQQSEHLKKQVNDLSEAVLSILSEFKLERLSEIERLGLANAQGIEGAVQNFSPEQRLGFTYSLSVVNAFNQALDAFPYEHEELVDFFDFCRRLIEQKNLTDMAEKVRDKAREVVDRGAQGFVARNARSGPKLSALNGLSIIAPDFKDRDWATTWDRNSGKSSQAWLWSQTSWPQMTMEVHRFAMFLPPEFLE